MSLELKNIEMKVGVETYIHETNLKLEKNTIKYIVRLNISWQNYPYANYGRTS